MSRSFNIDLTGTQNQPSIDHAVWGHITRLIIRFSLGLLVLFAAAGLALAGNKMSGDLQGNKSTGSVDVIVQFNRIPTNADLAPFSSSQVRTRFKHIKAAHLRLPMADIQKLEANPLVTYISPDRKVQGALDVSTQTVNANLAWSGPFGPSGKGVDGSGVYVAVIDSGVYLHPDLNTTNGKASRVVYSQDFTGENHPSDMYGHGTHVAGIIGSNGASSSGSGFSRTLKGVAPNANLINLRVLDENGAGQVSAIVAAIDFAIGMKQGTQQPSYNIGVINLSVGQQIFESYTLDPLCQAVEAAWNAGIVVVAAAGNNGRDNSMGTKGYGTIVSPGNDPRIITVGASNTMGTPFISDDTIATYSSKGPTLIDHIVKPDLVAPGNAIVSLLAPGCTLYTTYPQTQIQTSYYQPSAAPGVSTTYYTLSGTSMATPVVSGAVALMLENTPTLTPDQVKARLMKTAAKTYPIYSSGTAALTGIFFQNQDDIFTIGAGYLNVYAALQNTDLVNVPAISPQAELSPTGQVYLMFANNTTSKTTITFATNIVWGTNIVFGTNIVWGTTVFSGTSAMNTPILWGASTAVWGNSALGATNIVWGTSTFGLPGLQPFAVDNGDVF